MRMAAAIEQAGFWLPSEFLTDDDVLMDKENFGNELDTDFCFPSEFPYHFETHTDKRLQKFCGVSTSPQSTLAYLSAGVSNSGSPISALSPPTTPMGAKYDAVEDLIYLAADRVAKLRGFAANSCPPQRYLAQFHKEAKIPASSAYPNLQFENIGTRAAGGLGQVAWPPHQIPSPRKTAFIGGGAAAKKVCAGTGVFLPRRYDNISNSDVYSSAPRRKQGCSASSPFLARGSPQIHTKPSYANIYCGVDSQPEPQPEPIVGRVIASNHSASVLLDSVVASRHAALLQQRRSFINPMAGGSLMIGRDHQCLPREWSY